MAAGPDENVSREGRHPPDVSTSESNHASAADLLLPAHVGMAPYTVGYRKPPVSTRFQRGRSGNPKGRPRGSKSTRSLLEKVLNTPLRINEGGEIKTIEHRTALIRALVARAIKGDNRAATLVINLMDKLGLDDGSKAGVTQLHFIIGGDDPAK